MKKETRQAFQIGGSVGLVAGCLALLIGAAVQPTYVGNFMIPGVTNSSIAANSSGVLVAGSGGAGSVANIYNLVFTNGVANQTNLWGAGGAVATNNVDFNVYSQSYSTFTPYNFAGIVAPTNADEAEVLIQISNLSTTNVTGTWPVQFVMLVSGTLATSCTTTNGTTEYFWLHYTTANNGKRTNGVANQL